MTNKQLIKKLKNAYQVCKDCGTKYGVYSVGCSSSWEGVCDVCEETKSVTEARDYAYLVTGIRNLTPKTMEQTEPTIKYKSTVTRINITREEDNCMLGTEVSLEDEGGGRFIVLTDSEGNQTRLDFEEFDLVIQAVQKLRNQ